MEGLSQTVLSRIPFVRTNSLDDQSPKTDTSAPTSPASASTSPPPFRRQRKGSLRKTLLVASSRDHDHLPRRSSSSERSHPPSDARPSLTETPRADASTTDDDADHLTLRARSTSGSYNPLAPVPTPLSAPPAARRKTTGRSQAPSSLSKAIGVLADPIAETHDYSETEWWGWIILLSTWIVFVVGMGSCLGVWSWAWDVGETPYAPPELEDDPTLPIVGYYPALLVMTGVMAWVWVIVAWVGMKYFRHARVWDGED
jgi:Phosphatidylinositol N-acetylglucosaminyltransferase subunit Y